MVVKVLKILKVFFIESITWIEVLALIQGAKTVTSIDYGNTPTHLLVVLP